ncbi:MAG: type II toxin-antitoxin system RelE/ParE family toxin [Promethearchaeota archaeon]
MKSVTILEEAETEMNNSAEFYNQKVSGLGYDFLEAIEESITIIQKYPKRWKFIEDNIQKYNIRRFPFSLHYNYNESANKITIISIAHQKRLPGYWRNRVK